MISQSQPVINRPPPPTAEPPSTTPNRAEFRIDKRQRNQSVSQVFPFLNGGPNSTAYAAALDSCTCPKFGKQLHAHLLKNGFHGREFVEAKLLQMYGKCGCVDDAVQVFDKMPDRNLYTYTAILNVLLDNGLFEEALLHFERLLFEDVELEFFVFPVAFKICVGYGGVELGRQLQAIATKAGVLPHLYVGNALIDMYGKCGSLSYAEKVFNHMMEKDCVSWNSMVTACTANGSVLEALKFMEDMLGKKELNPNFVSWSALIGGFAQNGYDEEAVEMLHKMTSAGFEPNARILASVLPACARLREMRLGKEMYGYITRRGFMSSPYVVNGLIDLFRRCGAMENALNIFSKCSLRDAVSFNTMIVGYCENGEILKARDLFDMMESKDLISWNSMISGYADNSIFDEALGLLIDLMKKGEIKPDSFTLGSALGACAETGSLRLGRSIHSYCVVRGLESNLFVGGALVSMYCQCHDVEAADKVMQKVEDRDIVIWNALLSGYARCNELQSIQSVLGRMRDDGFEPDVYTWNGIIAGYVENGHHEMALQLFSQLQSSNLRADIYTVGIVIPACSRLATVERGEQVHAYAIRCGFEKDLYIRAALVDMYAKCGVMKYAESVHDGTRSCDLVTDLVTQNAMLNAYAMHGYGEEGIAFFREMVARGLKPDNVTFLAVLSSCVHAGSVEAGQEFYDMMGCYGVAPTLKHYTCMVDLLSRAGKLEQAYKMVERMPLEPDSVIWAALLGGCIIHGEVALGEKAAHELMSLEPGNSGHYVMLANLYASTGRWRELRRIRQQMQDEEMHKTPGCSWIEDRDETHVFMAWDRSHKRAREIYDMLDNLTAQMRLIGTCLM